MNNGRYIVTVKDFYNQYAERVIYTTSNHSRACKEAVKAARALNALWYVSIIDTWAIPDYPNGWKYLFPLREKNTHIYKALKKKDYARASYYSNSSLYRQSYNEYHYYYLNIGDVEDWIKEDILCDTCIGEKARKQLLDNFFPGLVFYR